MCVPYMRILSHVHTIASTQLGEMPIVCLHEHYVHHACTYWSDVMVFRLSGLSPFLGDNDMETLASVTRADFYFPDDDFPPVSDDAKEFICSLLVKNPRLAEHRAMQSLPLQ